VFGAGGRVLDWIIGLMLIIALALSALNAIMGSGRALYQMSLDGEFPKFFQKLNTQGVPHIAMGFNVVASLIVVLLGGAVEIYTFSNVGYTVSFVPVLIGYYLLRNDKPNLRRPFKLPEFMKYVALGLAAFYFIIWLYGGLVYSNLGNAQIYYWAGWVVLLLYLPFYWYRTYVEEKA
jgi:amino acid transporter